MAEILPAVLNWIDAKKRAAYSNVAQALAQAQSDPASAAWEATKGVGRSLGKLATSAVDMAPMAFQQPPGHLTEQVFPEDFQHETGAGNTAEEAANWLMPFGKLAGAAKLVASGLAKTGPVGGLIGSMIGRGGLVTLAKTEPETVKVLEAARKAGQDVRAAGGTEAEAMAAQAPFLQGTPYGGWRAAHPGGDYPQFLELSDTGARLSPSFDPRGVSTQTGLAPLPAKGAGYMGNLGSVFQHPDLEKFIPDLPYYRSEVGMDPTNLKWGGGGAGSFSTGGGWAYPQIQAVAQDPSTLRSVLLHEAGGHAAARETGLQGGSNIDWEAEQVRKMFPGMDEGLVQKIAERNYNNNPGEMAARTIESRRFLSGDELRNRSFQHDYAAQFQPMSDEIRQGIADWNAANPRGAAAAAPLELAPGDEMKAATPSALPLALGGSPSLPDWLARLLPQAPGL